MMNQETLELPSSLAAATWQEIAAYVRSESKAFAEAEREACRQAEAARNRAEAARDKAQQAYQDAMKKLVEEQELRWKAEEQKSRAIEEFQTACKDLERLQADYAAAVQACSGYEQKLQAETHARVAAEASRDDEQAAKQNALQELLKEHNQRQESDAALQSLQKSYQQLTSEHTLARQRLDELEQDLEVISTREAELVQEVAAMQRVQDDLQTDLEGVRMQLNDTMQQLATERDERAHAAMLQSEAEQHAVAVQAECQAEVNMERGLRHRAQVEVSEALKELARLEKAKSAAEVARNDLQSSLDNERRLRKQAEDERDQTLEWLREEQRRRREAEAHASDCAEKLQDLDVTTGRLSSLHGQIAQLEKGMQEQVMECRGLQQAFREEQQRRKAVEVAWQDTERARRDAVQERKAAEKAWQEISEMLAQTEQSRQEAVAAVLSERAARIMAQQSLESMSSDLPLSKEYSEQVRLALLHELQTERRAIDYMYQALEDVRESQKAVLQELALQKNALQGSLMNLGAGEEAGDGKENVGEEGKGEATQSAALAHVQTALEKLEAVRQRAFSAAEQAMSEVQAARDTAAMARQELEQARAALEEELYNGSSDEAVAAAATRDLVSRHLQKVATVDRQKLEAIRTSVVETDVENAGAVNGDAVRTKDAGAAAAQSNKSGDDSVLRDSARVNVLTNGTATAQ